MGVQVGVWIEAESCGVQLAELPSSTGKSRPDHVDTRQMPADSVSNSVRLKYCNIVSDRLFYHDIDVVNQLCMDQLLIFLISGAGPVMRPYVCMDFERMCYD